MAIEIVNWLNENVYTEKKTTKIIHVFFDIIFWLAISISFKLIVIIKKHNKQFASPLQIKEDEENGKLQQFFAIVLRKCNFIINIYRKPKHKLASIYKTNKPTHIYYLCIVFSS